MFCRHFSLLVIIFCCTSAAPVCKIGETLVGGKCVKLSANPPSTLLAATTTPPQELRFTYNGTAYTLIEQFLGRGSYSVPDCKHNVTHITTVTDTTLARNVFALDLHLNLDDDRCIKFDRQRNEFNVLDRSPFWMVGTDGKTFSYSWKFKLNSNYQVGNGFCHIHQIKLTGEGGLPNLTISTRPTEVDVRITNTDDTLTKLVGSPLSNFLGYWVSVREVITYGPQGCYAVVMTQRTSRTTNTTLMNFTRCGLPLGTAPGKYIRPKWGIYRSILDKTNMKSERIYYADQCIGEGNATCQEIPFN